MFKLNITDGLENYEDILTRIDNGIEEGNKEIEVTCTSVILAVQCSDNATFNAIDKNGKVHKDVCLSTRMGKEKQDGKMLEGHFIDNKPLADFTSFNFVVNINEFKNRFIDYAIPILQEKFGYDKDVKPMNLFDNKIPDKELHAFYLEYYDLLKQTEWTCKPFSDFLRDKGINGEIALNVHGKDRKENFKKVAMIFMESNLAIELEGKLGERISAEIAYLAKKVGIFKKKEVIKDFVFETKNGYFDINDVAVVCIFV